MKCWLCERGTNLDDGGLRPGELHEDVFGDMVCVYCENGINFLASIMDDPEKIKLVSEIQRLPKVNGVMVGIRFEKDGDK